MSPLQSEKALLALPKIAESEVAGDVRHFYDLSSRLFYLNRQVISALVHSSSGAKLLGAGRVVVLFDNVGLANRLPCLLIRYLTHPSPAVSRRTRRHPPRRSKSGKCGRYTRLPQSGFLDVALRQGPATTRRYHHIRHGGRTSCLAAFPRRLSYRGPQVRSAHCADVKHRGGYVHRSEGRR